MIRKKSAGALMLLLTLSCWSETDNKYLVQPTHKKKSKITVQQCYELMLSEMIWSSHIITLTGQNQIQMLSYIDAATLEKVDYKILQKIAHEEQEYIKALEQFAQAQKKHRAFHEEIKREVEAKKM